MRSRVIATSLPWRGLGLSSNLSATDLPQPYRLLDAEPGLFDFVEYSAPLSLDETRAQATLFPEMWRRRAEVPVLFHPVHLNLWGPELEREEDLAALDRHAREVGSAWVGNDVGWWHVKGQPFPGYLYIAPPLGRAGLAAAVCHALHVQQHLSVPLVLENPAVIARTGPLHVLDFMGGLHARTGLPLLLDMGHLLSFQLSAGLAPTAGFDGFPFEAVVELHLAGGVVTRRGTRRFYVDDHGQPVREEVFELLDAVVARCPHLRAITFEGDGHPPAVAAMTLRRLRRVMPQPTECPPLPAPSLAAQPAPARTLPVDDAPWMLFEALHGARVPLEDPEGTAAELDFRLAVMAEALDRDWPLSRKLLLGTRDALVAFAGSPEYRAMFEEKGRSLGHAFASHARRLLREHPDDGIAAVVTFETLLPRREEGIYPVDLTELVFAAGALERHLGGRAWASGQMELSGLEALRQVAARAPRVPWAFQARREGGRLRVSGKGTSACVKAHP